MNNSLLDIVPWQTHKLLFPATVASAATLLLLSLTAIPEQLALIHQPPPVAEYDNCGRLVVRLHLTDYYCGCIWYMYPGTRRSVAIV